MKKDKFIEGHQFYYKNCWYNFCVKCLYAGTSNGGRIITFDKQCKVEGNAEDFESNHISEFSKSNNLLFAQTFFSCKKCQIVSSLNDKYFDKDGNIYFVENKKDRLIERFFINPMNSRSNAIQAMRFPCSVTDDEFLVKEIIT